MSIISKSNTLIYFGALGAAYITKGSGTDFNSITDIGKYFVSADSVQLTNMPPTGRPATRGVLIVESKSTSGAFYVDQVYKEMAYESQIWTRKRDGETWSPWVRVDNFGCATPDALAIILGVEQEYGAVLTNIDLNTITSDYKAEYSGTAGVTNKPENNNDEFILICTKLSKGFTSPRVLQRAYYKSGHSYYRWAQITSGVATWEGWSRTDNFGANTPSDLASLLGGASMYVNANDANEVTIPGFYQNNNWIANTPCGSGILIMPYYLNGYWKFQIFCDNSSNHMWFRSGASTGYGPWKQIV